MTVTFNAFEVFEMAEQIEKNGVEFYQKAAENFKDSDAHNTLLELADWEKQHVATFVAMKNELTEEQRQPVVFDPDDEAALYLQVIADGHVFNVKEGSSRLLTGKESLKDIYNTAIGMEKESVVFYTILKDLVPADAGKDKVQTIIKEEISHIGILNLKLMDLE